MKQKPTFKSWLVIASFFSLFAFVFVNVHSSIESHKSLINTAFFQTELVESETKMAVPDVTVLGRLLEITQKLIDRKD